MLSKSIKMQAAAGLAAATVLSAMVVQTSRAAFSDTYSAPVANWDSGKVEITDGSSVAVAFTNKQNMVPGNSDLTCINVGYTGDVASNIKMYASTSTSGATAGTLADYLNFTVEEVTITGTQTCSNATVVASHVSTGTLSTFAGSHSAWANGKTLAWTTPAGSETKTFRLKVTLPDTATNAAQHKDVSATFTWEAQNV